MKFRTKLPYTVKLLSSFMLSSLGTLGCLFCIITAFGIPNDSTKVITASLFWCLLLSAIAIINNKRIRCLLLSLTAAEVIVAFCVNFNGTINGFKAALSYLFNRFVRFVPSLTPYFSEKALGNYSYSDEITCFFVIFSFVFALTIVMLFNYCRNSVASFIITLPFLASCLFILNTKPDLLPVCMLIAFWGVSFFIDLIKKSDSFDASVVAVIVLPVVAVLLIVMTLLIPMNGYKKPSAFTKIGKEINEILNVARVVVIDEKPSQEESEEISWEESDDESGEVSSEESRDIVDNYKLIDMKDIGNLTFTDKSHIELSTDCSDSILLRGYSMGDYYDDKWIPIDKILLNSITEKTGNQISSQQFSANSLLGVEKYLNDVRNITVTVITKNGDLIFTPENLLAIDKKYECDDSRYRFTDAAEKDFYSYSASFVSADIKEIMLNPPVFSLKYEKPYSLNVQQIFLRLPQDNTMLVAKRIIKEMNISDMSFSDKVNAIVEYVVNAADYSLSPGKTPDNVDFLTYFLFENKKGYCMHFATAATLLFRSAGIPARYVSGYYVEESDREGYRKVILTDRNAHAWVEVYYIGYGWIPIDVTPGFSGNISVHESSSEASEDSQAVSEESSIEESSEINESSMVESSEGSSKINEPSEIVSKEPISDPKLNEPSLDVVAIIVSLFVVLIIFAVIILNRFIHNRIRERRLREKSNDSALYAWRYIEKLSLYVSDIPKEIREIAEKSRFSRDGVSTEESETIAAFAEHLSAKIDSSLDLFGKISFRYFKNLH